MRSIITLFFLILLFVPLRAMLKDSDISSIYEKYVKPNLTQEYRYRYATLPMSKNKSFWPWEGKDLPRVIALLEFERFVEERKLSCNKGLAINGIDPEWHYVPNKHLVHIKYEDNPQKYDLHTLDLPEKDFDFVMVNQTLEHVYDPILCLKNIYKHMLPGGILYFSVPGNSILHDTPFHYYVGFTPVGVGALVKLAGFNILSIGHWANKKYLSLMHDKTNMWPDYLDFKDSKINDLENCPLIVWIFAQK